MISTDLNLIAATLEGLEETIINKLINRAQNLQNENIYIDGKSGFEGNKNKSLLNIRLRYQEEMDSRFGRFMVAEERPFCEKLPGPARDVTLPEGPLHIAELNTINLTADIKKHYITLLPELCMIGDDQQYGSSVENDITALQAVSRRIHYGAFYVAESKFLSNPGEYKKLIAEKNEESLLRLLTREEIEQKILMRIKEKVSHIQAQINPLVRKKIDPDEVCRFYKDCIIPLTKKGEILYLLNRIF